MQKAILFSAIITLVMARAVTVVAQEAVGQIKAIAKISGDKPLSISGPTPDVRIHRRHSGDWQLAAAKLPLYWRDRLLLRQYMCVAIEIKNKDQRGKIYILPDSLETQKENAVYEIREEPERQGQAAVYIAHGSLILDWAQGKLGVIALNIRSLFIGTEAAFVIDSTTATGYVFLDHGTMQFPDFPGIQVGDREIYRLRPGARPELVSLSAVQLGELRRFVDYASRKLWSRFVPWWHKPAFYIPAAVVGTAVAGAIIISNGDREIRGTVAIALPGR